MGPSEHDPRRDEGPDRRSRDSAARELAELAARAGATLDAWQETRDRVLEELGKTRDSVDGLTGSIEALASKEELAVVNTRARWNTVAIAVLLAAVLVLGGVIVSARLTERSARHRSDREVDRVVCEIGRKIDETVNNVLNRVSTSTTTSTTTVKECQ